MVYKSKHFIIQELVPPNVYNTYGPIESWRFIDDRLVMVLDAARDYFGVPITINNWHIGGTYVNSGFREPECVEGARLSAHKRGMGADGKLLGLEPEKVRETLIKIYSTLPVMNGKTFKELGLTTIEKGTPTWVHMSTENRMSEELVIVPFFVK